MTECQSFCLRSQGTRQRCWRRPGLAQQCITQVCRVLKKIRQTLNFNCAIFCELLQVIQVTKTTDWIGFLLVTASSGNISMTNDSYISRIYEKCHPALKCKKFKKWIQDITSLHDAFYHSIFSVFCTSLISQEKFSLYCSQSRHVKLY